MEELHHLFVFLSTTSKLACSLARILVLTIKAHFDITPIELPANIFNVPIRRDIIHNVFRYERHSKFRRFKRVKTVGDVAGSGKKPRPQKHTGRARQGNKRASINYHGGKIFGAVPKDFQFPLNKKVRLLAMKSLLSSRLMENRIVVVQDVQLDTYKTREFAKMVKVFGDSTILMMTEKSADINLKKASENLPKVTLIPAIVLLLL